MHAGVPSSVRNVISCCKLNCNETVLSLFPVYSSRWTGIIRFGTVCLFGLCVFVFVIVLLFSCVNLNGIFFFGTDSIAREFL